MKNKRISAGAGSTTFFSVGRNCWRKSTAGNFSLVIDGSAYFKVLRDALSNAFDQVMLIGWDFDFEIDMLPGESDADGNAPDGLPNQVGPFLEALAERRPNLDIYLLRWTGSAIIAPGATIPALKLSFFGSDRIRLAFDGRHPVGGCHHQKIVVIDDALAFCGGIDVTDARWDTPDHAPDHPLRKLRNGSPAPPWHDLAAAVTGPVAGDLGDLARARWKRATGEQLSTPKLETRPIWPNDLDVHCRDVPVAISRTEPAEKDTPLICEIERQLLDAIAAARQSIYLESQYFSCDSITEALERRLKEFGGPEVIVINPRRALGALEHEAMHETRAQMIERLAGADHEDRFRIWVPVNSAGEPIYVHAKICVIDDFLLRVGSSNVDQRSMGFDTECDLSLEGKTPEIRRAIRDCRNMLLAEHLNVEPAFLRQRIEREGRILPAVEALNATRGRGLRRMLKDGDTIVADVLAGTRLLDPRYERGEVKRTGLTARHVIVGALGALAIGAIRAYRRRDRT